jgi:hypothetical protein
MSSTGESGVLMLVDKRSFYFAHVVGGMCANRHLESSRADLLDAAEQLVEKMLERDAKRVAPLRERVDAGARIPRRG